VSNAAAVMSDDTAAAIIPTATAIMSAAAIYDTAAVYFAVESIKLKTVEKKEHQHYQQSSKQSCHRPSNTCNYTTTRSGTPVALGGGY
jgi:hypothetical protein